MFDFASRFAAAASWDEFLARHATEAERSRWEAQRDRVVLTDSQRARLGGYVRQMKVLVMAGTWCGDCVENCPILGAFQAAAPVIDLRFLDRDADPEFRAEMTLCGAPRVPQVVFLSEDDQFCGRAGDKPLAKYRYLAEKKLGNACPSGLVPPSDDLLAAMTDDWLDTFDHIQLILRLSGRLREKHGD